MFLRKLGFQKLISSNLRTQLSQRLKHESQLRGSYLLLLICSTIIATLGLLIDSSAVVIGAMLIAPLFWPIFGMSLSLVTANKHMGRSALKSFVSSLMLVLLVSFSVASVSPITAMTAEISSRIQPTLFDLLIALVASLVGIIAIYYPKLSASSAGVAISLALLPPLAIAGVGLAQGSMRVFGGSFLLFLSNVAAMILVSSLVLYLLKFRSVEVNSSKILVRLGSVFLVVLVLSIPLSLFLKTAINQSGMEKKFRASLGENLEIVAPGSTVSTVKLDYGHQLNQSAVEVRATLLIPEGESINQDEYQHLQTDLQKFYSNISIKLKLNLIRSLLVTDD